VIFQPDAIQLIRERKKTMTRRPIKPVRISGTKRRPLTVGVLPGYSPSAPTAKPAPCAYREGRVYACQPGRGQKGVLRITVTEVRAERLGDITPQDVRREGFRYSTEFRARWEELHGAWRPDDQVWAITFVVGDARGIWDQPRLLAARPGHVQYETLKPAPGKKHGRQRVATESMEEHQDYTTNLSRGLLDEGEPLTPQQLERLDWPDPERRARSLAARLRLAQKRGDAGEMRRIAEETASLAQQIDPAA
jgi:hypothetical protein